MSKHLQGVTDKKVALTLLQEKKITIEEYSSWEAELGAAKLMVNRNSSGGLYFRHPKVRGYSDAKSKEYTATVNLPKGVGESLFGQKDVLEEVALAVRSFIANERAAKSAKADAA